jgi:TRAP-type C4-dicarboxylate transport system permease small subunit
MLKKLEDIFDRIISFLDGAAATILVLVTLLICVHVFARYLFHSPIDWTVQMTEYSILLMVVLGSAWLLRIEGHVSVDIISIQLKPRAQSLLGFITSIIVVMVCIVIVWYGAKTSLDFLQRGIPVLGEIPIPKGILTGLIPVCFFLLLIQAVRRMVGCFKSWREKCQ